MPLQQFTAYDIIVDVIPGTIGIAGLALLAPTSVYEAAPSITPLIIGVGVLIGGYFMGRIIHSVSSQLPAQHEDPPTSFDIVGTVYDYYPSLGNKLGMLWRRAVQEDSPVDRITSVFLFIVNNSILLPKWLFHQMSAFLRLGDRSGIEGWLNGQNSILSEVDPKTFNEVRDRLAAEMGYHQYSPQINGRDMKKYGESILYGKNTLYNKYELLSTFFRNMTVLAFSLTLLGGLYLIAIYARWNVDFGFYNPTIPHSLQVYLFLTIGAGVVALAGRARKPVFERRRDRAFVYDLHQILTSK